MRPIDEQTVRMILRLHNHGMPIRKIAREARVGVSTVQRTLQRRPLQMSQEKVSFQRK